MNIPIEICAIVEDYLPVEFDKKARKDLWKIARYFLDKLKGPRPRDIENRTLVSGLGSKKFPIYHSSCYHDISRIESKYLSISISPIAIDEDRSDFRFRRMKKNQFMITIYLDEYCAGPNHTFNFLVNYIQ